MSDEERIKKLIENHDENLLRLEEWSKEKRKKKKSLHPLSCYFLPDDEYCKYNTDDIEFLNYLKRYTKTLERAQRELNFVRIQSDKWGHDYEAMRDVYVNNFFPAINNAKIKKEVAHNLFISLLEYATANSLTDGGAIDIIQQLSDIINIKRIPTSKDLEDIDEQFDIKDFISYTITNTNNKNLNNLYGNLANHLHYKFHDKALEEIDPVVLKYKNIVNEQYDLVHLPELFNFLLSKLPYNIGSLLLKWYNNSPIRFKKTARENFTYNYDKYQGEREFFTPEEQDMLYGVIKKYNPGPHLFWRKAPSNPYEIPPTNIETEDELLNFENKNDRQNDITLSSSMQEIEPTLNTDVKNNTIDISTEVKRILANTIDDFVQLKGFKKNKIT